MQYFKVIFCTMLCEDYVGASGHKKGKIENIKMFPVLPEDSSHACLSVVSLFIVWQLQPVVFPEAILNGSQ